MINLPMQDFNEGRTSFKKKRGERERGSAIECSPCTTYSHSVGVRVDCIGSLQCRRLDKHWCPLRNSAKVRLTPAASSRSDRLWETSEQVFFPPAPHPSPPIYRPLIKATVALMSIAAFKESHFSSTG